MPVLFLEDSPQFFLDKNNKYYHGVYLQVASLNFNTMSKISMQNTTAVHYNDSIFNLFYFNSSGGANCTRMSDH